MLKKEKELNNYLLEDQKSSEYWPKKKNNFPCLNKMAQKYLSIPASTGSERVL